jgi:hypothetical protein
MYQSVQHLLTFCNLEYISKQTDEQEVYNQGKIEVKCDKYPKKQETNGNILKKYVNKTVGIFKKHNACETNQKSEVLVQSNAEK